MAELRGAGPQGGPNCKSAIDSGTLMRRSSNPPGCVAGANAAALDQALRLLEAELANLGGHAMLDGHARARYDQLARDFRNELQAEVRAGRLDWRQAAERANELRDELMQLTRRRSTPVGRALAESLKAKSPGLNEMVARKTLELHGAQARFDRLTPLQQQRVYAGVVESAGKSNPRVTARMRTLSRAGRGLLFLGLAVAVYQVASAEDPGAAALREGAALGAGIAGGAAAGALAGLACGPGAPICVGIGAFVGGALAAAGADWLWPD